MLLIGTGSHASRLVTLFDLRAQITAAASPTLPIWLNSPVLGDAPIRHYARDEDALAAEPGEFVMGMGGTRPEALARRLGLARAFQVKGWKPLTLQHHAAYVTTWCRVLDGAQIMNGAQVSAHCLIGQHALINAGAIVEHHAVIGPGTHVAPGAIVLGNANVGRACMIGAGAIVIEGTTVPDETFVKAGTIWKGERRPEAPPSFARDEFRGAA